MNSGGGKASIHHMLTPHPPAFSVSILSAILLTALGSSAQETGTGQTGAGATGPAMTSPAATEMLAAQFQATFYEIQATPDKVGTLDAKALARQATTPEALLKVLSDVGKSRILYRIDQPVNVYSEGITIGRSEPVIMGTRTDAAGNAINSISYQTVGVIIRLSAQVPPKEGNPPQPTVTMSARLSDLPSGNDGGAGEKQMGARGVTFEHGEPLVFGQPIVVVEQTTTTAYMVRYLFSPSGGKLGESSGTVTSRAEPANATPSTSESQAPKEVLPAQFQATVYEIQAAPDRVGTLDAKTLAGQAATPEALLQALGDVGKARILHRIDQPVNVCSERITVFGSEPMVAGIRVNAAGEAVKSIIKQNVGVIIQLSAVPPTEGDHRQPTVAMSVNLSAMAPSATEIGAGQKASAMRNIKLEHSEPLEFNRPRVMLAVSSSSAVEQVTPAVYVIRYLFSPPIGK